MRPSLNRPKGQGAAVFWDLLTFEHLMTNQDIHLIYWAGLGIIVLGVFRTIGAAVGVAFRDPSLMGALIAIPVLVGGLLAIGALLLLSLSFCSLSAATFNISAD